MMEEIFTPVTSDYTASYPRIRPTILYSKKRRSSWLGEQMPGMGHCQPEIWLLTPDGPVWVQTRGWVSPGAMAMKGTTRLSGIKPWHCDVSLSTGIARRKTHFLADAASGSYELWRVHDTDLLLVELPLSRGRSRISMSGSGFQNFKNSLSVCLFVLVPEGEESSASGQVSFVSCMKLNAFRFPKSRSHPIASPSVFLPLEPTIRNCTSWVCTFHGMSVSEHWFTKLSIPLL
jgi:hypothetical protein